MQIPGPGYAIVLLWGLIFMPFLALPIMITSSVLSIAAGISRKISPHRTPDRVALEQPWSRRKWLTAFAASLPITATYAAGIFSLPTLSRFRIREMTLFLDQLPATLDGITIAHLTDTHVGKFTRGKMLDDIVEATHRLKPDLVLFTGDLIDNSLRDLPEAVAMLQKIQIRTPLFLIEGNHDLFDDPLAFEKGIRDAGLTLLRNQSATLQIRGVSVQILGIVWSHHSEKISFDVEQVASLRTSNSFPILLAHHPHAFDQAAKQGIPLTLAGHTHGGQLMLTPEIGVGPLMFRYWSGLYQKANQALIVSNGTGNWFPIRSQAPAEIIHLTLRKA